MNRLTERKENGVINVRYATEHETAIHRLTSIEDILGDTYDIDRLRELVEADREGRCAVLPCKPGDSVWMITKRGVSCVERWTVHRVYKRDTGDWYFVLKNMMLSRKRPNEFEVCERAISSFGKTVFPTREAAEQALKERSEDG